MKIHTLTLGELANIIEASTITATENHAGMVAHTIEHPTYGTALLVSSIESGALMIS